MSLIKVNTIQNANGTTALTIAANGQLSSVNTAVANVTTLNATSGVLATQNGMAGIAKAWVSYNGSTQTILGSFNVSSVTRSSAGIYTINFTTAMPNANYAITSFIRRDNDGSSSAAYIVANQTQTKTTSALGIRAGYIDNGGGVGTTDFPEICIAILSS